MDDHTVLKINLDGSRYVEQPSPVPTSSKIELVGQQPQPRQPVSQEQVIAARAERTAKQGRFAWSLLHGYRGCDPQWLDIWQYLIPARCDCKDGYQKILEQMPPDHSSPEAFFAWGVALHNAVNAKLGKPQITLDEAYSIWRKDDGMEHKETTAERS
jgi:hypothetical protein